MYNDNVKEEILSRWEEILSQITSPAKKRGEYICPFCSHGKGGDGLKLNPKSTKYGLKCFGGCGFSGDIIELVGRLYSIDSFPERLQRAGSIIGIDTEERQLSSKPAQNQPKNERSTHTHMSIHTDTYTDTQPPKDYSSYYLECNKRLGEIEGYLSSRGISLDVAKKRGLGYEPECRPYGEKSSEVWKALIIPTTRNSYVARNLDTKAVGKDRYSNVGKASLYLKRTLTEASSPIFIVEGELDALSIETAGGEAVGLGSTSNMNKLIEAIKEGKPTQPLILALDNDKAGDTASEELERKLSELEGIVSYRFNIYGDKKDANEALTADRESFISEVKGISQRIEALKSEELREELEEYNKGTVNNHLQAFINGIAESANTPATPTGFSTLDELLDGGLYEGLYCVGAISSLGKTTFLLQMCDQIAQSGKDVFIFSLEMAESELISKSVSRLTLLETLSRGEDTKNAKTNRGITTGSRWKYYSDLEKDIISSAVTNYEAISQHIRIFEGIGEYGVDSIKEAVAKHKRLTGSAPIVIVDYIQILAPYDERLTDKQNMDKTVIELKRLSRDYKTPIIGISSFNRDNYTEPVNLSSFKESGAIEYSSDVLIGLQYEGMDYRAGESDTERKKRIRELREEVETRGRDGLSQRVEVKVLKNRNGYKGRVQLDYFPRFNYFKTPD